ncbi:hypothetical protein LINGRAHAP2_LOCUS31692 [Linum grandiflorum]
MCLWEALPSVAVIGGQVTPLRSLFSPFCLFDLLFRLMDLCLWQM